MQMKRSRPRFLQRLALNVHARYRHTQARLHELTYLFWECTLRCNLKCLHCGSDCLAQSNVHDMPLEDFLRVVDEIGPICDRAKTIIVLTGGEPLMRNDLDRCGAAFEERGHPWGMVSNGYILSQDRLRSLLANGLNTLTISLDGLEDSHNWLRGRDDSYERALDAIRAAIAAEELVFDVVTCVNQKNFDELPALRDMLGEMGLTRWRLFTIFPKGRASDNELLDVTNEQFRQLMEFILETRDEGTIQASYSCEGFLGPYEGKVREGFFWCRAGINVGSVLADGSISACPSLRGDYIQGDIYRGSFVDVWNNRFQVMRDRAWTKTGICAECDAYKWCEGNGLHLRDEQTGHLLRCHYHMLEGDSAPTVTSEKRRGEETTD